MRMNKKSARVKATNCPPQIIITVTTDKSPGRYRACVEGEQEPLCVSRQPFLDSARKLLWRGYEPSTVLVMRWPGATDWALRGPLELAAKLTIDEHNSTFAKWKPYSRSAAPPRIRKFTCHVPEDRPATKATIESTADKGRPAQPMVQQIGGGQADVR